MTLFKDKYRVKSTRLSNRDYAANGLYFVTICTGDRACFFGEKVNPQIHLSASLENINITSDRISRINRRVS
jgi:hypothetical protein